MRRGASSEQEQDDSEADFVEVDPTCRYGRYKELLGKGAFKKVYRAFDELEGIEVAWNQVKVSEVLRNSEDLERLYSEVHLLKTLKHKNIIKFYNSWVDTKNEHINLITEIFTSGTLRQYRKKHKRVDLRALKKWSKQILEGLLYLHSHDPPVIHRDLKCDNIFVNGNHGELKIGDLGLAAILTHANAAHSVIGTPEFMAPELYDEEYNELVDIYAFGMCLLELVTFEYPYIECSNAAQIYKKVTSGTKPASLEKVTDTDVRAFIEKCISNVTVRLSAKDLLNDPFLAEVSPETTRHSSHANIQLSDTSSVSGSVSGHNKSDIPGSNLLDNPNPGPSNRDLSVRGERKDDNTVKIKLRIAGSPANSIHFLFDIEGDTSIAVASEMVQELDLMDQDIPTVAEMMDSEIGSIIPDWSPRDSSDGDSPFESHTSECKEDSSPREVFENKDDISPSATASPFSASSYIPDQLPSSHNFSSDSPKTTKSNSIDSSEPTEEQIFQNDICVQNLGNSILLEPNTDNVNIVHGEASTDNLAKDVDKACDGLASVKNSKVVQDRGGLPPKNSAIFHVGSDDGSMFRDTITDGTISDKRSEDKPYSCCSKKNDNALLSVRNDEVDISDTDFGIIVFKLDQLLAQQQKQLDELKSKHRLEIFHVLKDLPSQMHMKVLDMCSRKISYYKVPSQATSHMPNVPESNGPVNSPKVPLKRIFTRSFSTIDLSSPKPNLKQESTSEIGIAVILKDDSEES